MLPCDSKVHSLQSFNRLTVDDGCSCGFIRGGLSHCVFASALSRCCQPSVVSSMFVNKQHHSAHITDLGRFGNRALCMNSSASKNKDIDISWWCLDRQQAFKRCLAHYALVLAAVAVFYLDCPQHSMRHDTFLCQINIANLISHSS